MKIAALGLDDREQDGRREIIQSKVDTRRWYSCITSVDLRYVVPIIVTKGRYETSLPIEFRCLGIKQKIKKFFSHVRSDAEKMIFQAATAKIRRS
jgi:ERCC4-type nuclease